MKKDESLSRRVYILMVVMGIWGTAIGARLYFLHVVHSADYKERAARQQQRTLEVSPRRGNIYDRNGNELAVSIKVDSVFAIPGDVENPKAAAKAIASAAGLSRKDVLEKLSSDKSFVWIKRRLTAAESEAIRKLDLSGIYFQKEDRRFYPQRQLAAHVLGYVNIDEEGMGGLEYRYNDSVRGDAGRVVVMTDARGRSFNRVEEASVPGANLVTTIDEQIQYIIEKELAASAASTRAKGISIVAMDPRSGEILGMANYPTFNPNEYARYTPTSWINRSISHIYEPGSTFKIATAATALEEKLTTPDEVIDCQMGSIVLYGKRIRDAHKYGLLTVKEIIQNSSNVGAIKLGLRIGDERFANYIERLGFGRVTNVDLPGEERGLTKPASRWSKISIGAISMGQEIGVTPLQIVSMVSAIANGGILYKPFVVKKIQDERHGVVRETEPQGIRIVSAQTARQLQEMLEVVVTDGTAKASKLAGYTAAGKTGTAQKIDETGRYAAHKYVASFAGYAPASNPTLALIVVVDEPVGAYYGAQVAAPIFKNIAEQILRYRSVPPDMPSYAPEYTFEKEKKPAPEKPTFLEPPPPALIPASLSADAMGPPELGSIEIPDFYGKSLRQVAEECLKAGLRFQSIGSGAAVEQSPPPGSYVPAGTRMRVRFSTRLVGR
jgi:cell division protein FtsI (penicillin-binding protein 3)